MCLYRSNETLRVGLRETCGLWTFS